MIFECPSVNCTLYDYRLRKMPKIQNPSSLKAIKLFCLDCAGGHPSEVKKYSGKLIDGSTCVLHQYRFGRNPKRKGIVSSGSFRSKSTAQSPV